MSESTTNTINTNTTNLDANDYTNLNIQRLAVLDNAENAALALCITMGLPLPHELTAPEAEPAPQPQPEPEPEPEPKAPKAYKQTKEEKRAAGAARAARDARPAPAPKSVPMMGQSLPQTPIQQDTQEGGPWGHPVIDSPLVEDEAVLRRLVRTEPHRVLGVCDPKHLEAAQEQEGAFDTRATLKEQIGNEAAFAALWLWASTACLKAEHRKRLKAAKRRELSSSNRAEYLPTALIERTLANVNTPKERRRWQATVEMKPLGLMDQAVNLHYGEQAEPTSVHIRNSLPLDDKGRLQTILTQTWDYLERFGVAVSGGRLGWNKNTPAWAWLLNVFGSPTNIRSYCHSLAAPLVPRGFMRTKVQLEMTKTMGADAGKDGSAWIHPDHPLFAQLMRLLDGNTYCDLQFRALQVPDSKTRMFEHEEFDSSKIAQYVCWMFAKGMLHVSEDAVDADGNPTIIMDWNQFKGKRKGLALKLRDKEVRAEIEVYLGIIRCFDKTSKMAGCFELLQQVDYNKDSVAWTEASVEAAIRRLVERGAQGQLNALCEDDDQMRLQVKFAEKLGQDPLGLQNVRAAIEARVQRRAWKIFQGGGISGQIQVAIIDQNAVKRGEIVIPGVPVGIEVLVWRYPMVLNQGLVILKTVEPAEHLLVRGKPVSGAAIMNPGDIITRMQGDDDGDTLAFVTDPELIRIVKEGRPFDDILLIEPKSDKFSWKITDAEGKALLRSDPMGPTGQLTMLQAKLLAVHDYMGAVAVAILIQESIDMAKGTVKWSNFYEAVNWEKWTKVIVNGEECLRWDIRFTPEQMPTDIVAAAQKWAADRLEGRGLPAMDENKRKVNGLGWRNPAKIVDFANLCRTEDAGNWHGGNLVHVSWNHAVELWEDIGDQFWGEEANKQDDPEFLREALEKMLASEGINPNVPDMEWREYLQLRDRAGLRSYVKSLWEAKRMPTTNDDEEDAKRLWIQEAKEQLNSHLSQLSLDEIATIWWYEMGPDGNPHNAWRVVSYPGSPLLPMLGIEDEAACSFLTPERINTICRVALADPNPHRRLAELIVNSTLHEKEKIGEQGDGIPGYSCKHCCKTLEDNLVNIIRKERKETSEYVRNLQRVVNAMDKPAPAK